MTSPIRFSVVIPTFRRCHSLRRLLESIRAVQYPPDAFETVVVNDGSTDDTAGYLDSLADTARLHVLTIPNSGPAVARNAGARIARGEYLVFVDDDCSVPPGWLDAIESVLREGDVDLLGGDVRNALPGNSYAAAYDANHHFFASELNRDGEGAQFLTTNNLVCRRAVFRELGGFDERFHVGGEDREFVSRVLAAGRAVRYDPSVHVDHHHDFRLRSFVQQYYRFGKGGYLLHAVVAPEKNLRTASLSTAGYLRLLLGVGRGERPGRRVVTAVLTVLAQTSAALGYLATSWEGLRDLPGERRRIHSPDKLGVQGRVRELLSYLLGTLLSSVLGFVAFFLLGRTLSMEEYGVFTSAFSLTTIIQTLGAVGLAAAMTRHMGEVIKTGDAEGRRTMLATGAVLFVSVLTVLVVILVVLWEPMRTRMQVSWTGSVLPLIVAGTVGATAFEFLSSAYQVSFRLLRLALLRFVVSGVRLAAIGALLLRGYVEPLVLYAAFFAPSWVGAIAGAREYLSLGLAQGRVRVPMVRRLASYGGWQTLSSATVILLQHAGALILASTAGEEQVGMYGLGMAFSFVYGVVGAALGSYYLPIASRLRSHEDVREFLRRTTRINVPIVILSLLSLFVAVPLFEWFLGPAKHAAVPVFVLLSLAAITGIGSVAFLSLFHHFLQPRSITYAQTVSISAFALAAVLFAEGGAVGMGGAFLASRVTLLLALYLLMRREFRKRGIAP